MIIDLEEEFDLTHKSLNGFDTGHSLRNKYGLDDLDAQEEEKVSVVFPHYIWSVSGSFFKGMFLPSYKKLGQEGFSKRYEFDSESHLTGILNACVEELHEFVHAPRQVDLEDEDVDWHW
jgi:hypothetical protein